MKPTPMEEGEAGKQILSLLQFPVPAKCREFRRGFINLYCELMKTSREVLGTPRCNNILSVGKPLLPGARQVKK